MLIEDFPGSLIGACEQTLGACLDPGVVALSADQVGDPLSPTPVVQGVIIGKKSATRPDVADGIEGTQYIEALPSCRSLDKEPGKAP